MINWMSTGNYLVVHYGRNRPCILEKGTDKYAEILGLLSKSPQVSENEIIRALDIGSQIESYSEGTFKFDEENETVTIDGQNIDNAIANRIIEFCKTNQPYLPLVNFWRNIQQNPSESSKKELFLFLDANKMPITHDGCFLAYKKVVRDVEGNLVDAHSKTFCNNIGAVVTMDRAHVDPDRRNTCSHGLHVAAYDYAAHSYSGTDLLEVKVNPKDVVSVPDDYNDQKMRVCRYEVVAINKAGPIQKPYLPKEEIRAKRKLGEKTVKSQKQEIKAGARAKEKADLEVRLNSLKQTKHGETVDLANLTAAHVVDIVKSLTGVDIMVGLASMKDKRLILKRAKAHLEENEFVVA